MLDVTTGTSAQLPSSSVVDVDVGTIVVVVVIVGVVVVGIEVVVVDEIEVEVGVGATVVATGVATPHAVSIASARNAVIPSLVTQLQRFRFRLRFQTL
jgi:hypothetical protein